MNGRIVDTTNTYRARWDWVGRKTSQRTASQLRNFATSGEIISSPVRVCMRGGFAPLRRYPEQLNISAMVDTPFCERTSAVGPGVNGQRRKSIYPATRLYTLPALGIAVTERKPHLLAAAKPIAA